MVLAPAPIVSVIMSMRDSAATIDAAIRSIIWQTFTDWELILIDDGSRDDGAARAARFADSRIRIVLHLESRGPACRRNEAIDLARGEFIAVMDADDICYPERLAVQVSALRSDPGIDVLATKAVLFRRQGEVLGLMRAPTTHEEIVAYPYRGFPSTHPTWCGRAAWFRKNRYDEGLRVAEDQELLLRTAACSRFATVDKILLGYRKERMDILKNFYGRVLYTGVILRHARQSRAYLSVAVETALQIAKSVAELVAVGVGAEEWLLKQKLVPSTPDDVKQWRLIWDQTSRSA